jgi:RNA polymerase sigma factor (sigma-70 family)
MMTQTEHGRHGHGRLADLVARARDGDDRAWGELVARYAPLVMSVCRRHRLGEADTLDVAQGVWLTLLEHLDAIREPAALPGWIATTTRRECLHLLTGKGGRQRQELVGEVDGATADLTGELDDMILRAERHAALLEALGDLPPQHQQLVVLLIHDPPLGYTEIGRRLNMPVGSIGPTRARCLDKLRHHPAVAALIERPATARPPLTATQGT